MANLYDILLDQNGDLPISPRHVTGRRRIAQKIRNRLSIHRGEWKKDTSKGMPYEDWIFDLMQDVPAIGGYIRTEIETTPGVVRLDDFEISKSGETITTTGTIIVENNERIDFRQTVGRSEFGNFESVVHFHFPANAVL